MNKKFSNLKATLSITKASLISSFRNFSNVFFGLLFPFIFIMIFGFFGNDNVSMNIGVMKDSNKGNMVYESLKKIEVLNLVEADNEKYSNDDLEKKLEKGEIDAIVNIDEQKKESNEAKYIVDLTTSNTSVEGGNLFKQVLNNLVNEINLSQIGKNKRIVETKETEISGREYKTIDFILPGMLGMALMNSGIFGTAFTLLNLRNTFVIKRMMATPTKRYVTILGEGLSRLIFALMQILVIITVGTLALDFTMVNGFETFINMTVLAIIGLAIFLGFGFVISNISKTEQSAAPLANLVTMPQFLLSGVFFDTAFLPEWLQPISKILPLYHLSNGMREISFEGANLWDMKKEILILIAWGLVIYFIASKTFKWEAD